MIIFICFCFYKIPFYGSILHGIHNDANSISARGYIFHYEYSIAKKENEDRI